MNARSFLFASSMMALLAGCTEAEVSTPLPKGSRPEEIPGPTYTTTITATLTPAPGGSFHYIAAASAGDEGAVVYTELDGPDGQGGVRWSVVLQRFDATGAVSGPRVELDTVDSKTGAPAPTVATDGSRYLACWQRDGSIACAGVPVGQGPASPALSVDGAAPSLAYGSGAFALAYGVPEHVRVVRVGSDGSTVGSPASFDTGEGTNPKAFLAATESGFVLLGGDDKGIANARARLLDSSFSPIASSIDLGTSLWSHAAVAAHGTNVAIGFSEPYGGLVAMLDDGEVTHVHAFAVGDKLGMNVALLANEASFDMLSTYDADGGYVAGGLRYRTLQGDEVTASEQGLLTEHDFEQSEIALLRLHGDLFLAATQGPVGDAIVIARVHQP